MPYSFYRELAACTDGCLYGASLFDGHKDFSSVSSSTDTGDSRENGLGYCGDLGDRPIWTVGWDPATFDITMWFGGGFSLHHPKIPSLNLTIVHP